MSFFFDRFYPLLDMGEQVPPSTPIALPLHPLIACLQGITSSKPLFLRLRSVGFEKKEQVISAILNHGSCRFWKSTKYLNHGIVIAAYQSGKERTTKCNQPRFTLQKLH